MSNRIFKLTENQILDLVQKVITEQTANDKPITISGSFGQAGNKFSALGQFVNKIIDTVNVELQGETPYIIRRVKKGSATGVISSHTKTGEEKSITINLIPSTEQKRYYFFTCSAAIYSEATDFNYLVSELRVNAAKKSRLFMSETVYYLGLDTLDLSDFDNLNPQQPDKKYKLLLIYFAGTTAQGLSGDNTAPEVSAATTATEPAKTEPVKTETKKVTRNISGSFTSTDGDSAHNFKVMETKLDNLLVEMYNSGINPKITAIDAKITVEGEQSKTFTTKYSATVSNSPDGKAWMGFTSRGSFGSDYIKRADGQIDGSENKDGRSLEEKLKSIGAGDIELIKTYLDSKVPVKQMFYQFTKPEKYPAK
jgi:hypothetical protein